MVARVSGRTSHSSGSHSGSIPPTRSACGCRAQVHAEVGVGERQRQRFLARCGQPVHLLAHRPRRDPEIRARPGQRVDAAGPGTGRVHQHIAVDGLRPFLVPSVDPPTPRARGSSPVTSGGAGSPPRGVGCCSEVLGGQAGVVDVPSIGGPDPVDSPCAGAKNSSEATGFGGPKAPGSRNGWALPDLVGGPALPRHPGGVEEGGGSGRGLPGPARGRASPCARRPPARRGHRARGDRASPASSGGPPRPAPRRFGWSSGIARWRSRHWSSRARSRLPCRPPRRCARLGPAPGRSPRRSPQHRPRQRPRSSSRRHPTAHDGLQRTGRRGGLLPRSGDLPDRQLIGWLGTRTRDRPDPSTRVGDGAVRAGGHRALRGPGSAWKPFPVLATAKPPGTHPAYPGLLSDGLDAALHDLGSGRRGRSPCLRGRTGPGKARGPSHHRFLGFRVVLPLVQRLQVDRGQLPPPHLVDLPDDEPGPLLGLIRLWCPSGRVSEAPCISGSWQCLGVIGLANQFDVAPERSLMGMPARRRLVTIRSGRHSHAGAAGPTGERSPRPAVVLAHRACAGCVSRAPPWSSR